MTRPLDQVQPLLAFAAAHLDEDLSLRALANQAGFSAFHLHRVFSAAAGETPKQFTLRLRLSRATAMLLTTNDSILEVALACGFQSHEVFCRVFRKRFGITPSGYRERGFTNGARAAQKTQHVALVDSVGRCIGLFHVNENGRSQKNEMAYLIAQKEVSPQPVLVVTRRVKMSEIAATLAEAFGKVFGQAQQNGIAIAGPPFTRYLDWGPGVFTIEAGIPVVAGSPNASLDGDVRADILPGGAVAATTHAGPYDKLSEAHAAVQQWIEAEGLAAAGAPWEVYVTDPADHPDPQDWKTEVFWPIRTQPAG
jgi:AraC family transcriptional regulator